MTIVTLNDNPLVSALLELDATLPADSTLCIGGGLGLYVKQAYIRDNPQIKTLFRPAELPAARTTEDIDLFLRAEVVTSSNRMEPIREALDELAYKVVDTAKYMQFYKEWGNGIVKIDLLAGPLGDFAALVPNDPRRVRPRPSVHLHAHRVDEALAIDQHRIAITLRGRLPSGEDRETVIRIPQAFTYLLMKLNAFADQLDNPDKKLGRHHALDLYRIVGMLMESEDREVRGLVRQYDDHDEVTKARRIVRNHFVHEDGKGRLRIREHELWRDNLDLERFGRELETLLQPSSE